MRVAVVQLAHEGEPNREARLVAIEDSWVDAISSAEDEARRAIWGSGITDPEAIEALMTRLDGGVVFRIVVSDLELEWIVHAFN